MRNRHLVILAAVRLHEAEGQEELTHLRTVDVAVWVEDRCVLEVIRLLVGDEANLAASLREVQLEPVVDDLVGLATDLRRVDRRHLRLIVLADLMRDLLPPVSIVSECVDAALEVLRLVVNRWLELLILVTLLEDDGFFLHTADLSQLNGIHVDVLEHLDGLFVDFRLERVVLVDLLLNNGVLEVLVLFVEELLLVLDELLLRAHTRLFGLHDAYVDKLSDLLLFDLLLLLALVVQLFQPLEVLIVQSLVRIVAKFGLVVLRVHVLVLFILVQLVCLLKSFAVSKHLVDFGVGPLAIGAEFLDPVIELNVVNALGGAFLGRLCVSRHRLVLLLPIAERF